MATRRARVRLALLLAGAASVTTTSQASQPPEPTRDELVEQFRRQVEAELACPDLAREPGVFGGVEVVFTTSERFTARASKALGPRFAACVTRAVKQVWPGFPVLAAGQRQYSYESNAIEFSFGKPHANLPEPSRLVPVWKTAQRYDTTALRALLPADVAVRKDGCLLPDGEAIRAGVDLWLEQWTKQVAFRWSPLFTRTGHVRLIEPASLVVVELGAYCLLPLDDARERALRPRLEEGGACWRGKAADILVAPRAGFPTDRRYRSVSIARDRACAVDAAGAIVCCGSPPPLRPPQGSFKSVSVGKVHACAVRSDDTITCWSLSGALAPFDSRYAEVVVGDVTACARRLDGRFECRGDPLDVSGDIRQVSLGAGGHCVLRRDGTLACSEHGEKLQPPPRPPIAVDRNYTTCVLVEDGEVLCPQNGTYGAWGAVSRERFKAIAATSWGGCGRRQDDTVGCWGRVPGPGPQGRFTSLEAGDSYICGIRDDGRIVCWGEGGKGRLWTDFE